MTTAHKITAVVAGIFLLLSIVFVRGWILEREARATADTTAQVEAAQIAAKDDAIKTRDQANAQTVAALTAQAAALQTPQQAAKVIMQYLPAPAAVPGQPAAAPVAVPIVTKADLPTSIQAQLPNAPTYGILTGDQLVAQAKKDIACDATTHDAATCKADLADTQANYVAEQKTSQAWENAAKGGTKLQRFLTVLKYGACGAAGGFAGSQVHKQNPGTTSAIGAGAGVAVCSLF